MNYYGITMNDDYLAHHGVKGQKWGVRHDKSSGGLSRKQKKKNYKQVKKIIGRQRPYSHNYLDNSSKRASITRLVNNNISNDDRQNLQILNKETSKQRSVKRSKEAFRNEYAYQKKVIDNILGSYGRRKINTFSLDDTTYATVANSMVKWGDIRMNQVKRR